MADDLRKTVIAHCDDLLNCAAALHEDGRFKATAAEIRFAVSELKYALAAPSSLVADDGLPKLPQPTVATRHGTPCYTADQVRQAQREAVEADRRKQEYRIKHLEHERDVARATCREFSKSLEEAMRAATPQPPKEKS